MRSTKTTSPIDSKGDERDLECNEPMNGMPPPSANRRAELTALLDMVLQYSWARKPSIDLKKKKKNTIKKKMCGTIYAQPIDQINSLNND